MSLQGTERGRKKKKKERRKPRRCAPLDAAPRCHCCRDTWPKCAFALCLPVFVFLFFSSPRRDKSKCLLCSIHSAEVCRAGGQGPPTTTTTTLPPASPTSPHGALTCGGMQTLQAPIARQDPSERAAQAAAAAATATHASAHPETSVHHAVHPSAYRASSV